MEKFLSRMMIILVEFFINAFVFLLLAYIVVDVSVLYDVDPIKELSYINLLGFLLVLKLATLRSPKEKEIQEAIDADKKELKDVITMAIMKPIINCIIYLSAWLMCYVVYWVAL